MRLRTAFALSLTVFPPSMAAAQLATGPAPFAGAAPSLDRPFAPCRAALASVAIKGRDDGILVDEKPDIEDSAVPDSLAAQRAYMQGRRPAPTRGARIAWTYLKGYSAKPGDLFAVCTLKTGQTHTVELPVGTVSCDFVGGSLTCR